VRFLAKAAKSDLAASEHVRAGPIKYARCLEGRPHIVKVCEPHHLDLRNVIPDAHAAPPSDRAVE